MHLKDLKDCMTFVSDTAIEKEEGVISGRKMRFSLSPTCRCRLYLLYHVLLISGCAGGNDGSSFPAGKTGSKIDAITPREESTAKEKGYLYPHTTADSLFVWSQWGAAGFSHRL